MKLYQFPGSCSDATAIVLAEINVSVEPVTVNLRDKALPDGSSLMAINPKGQVPTLVLDSGEILTEGAVILQYLADLAPQSGLLPPHPELSRYRVLEWLNYIATELHKTFSPLNRPHTPPDYREQIKTLLLPRAFGVLERRLSASDYLAGDSFTIADAYAFVVLGWAGRQEIDLSGWPHLCAYLARIADRPAVRTVMAQREGTPA
ncbi:glutathione transferase GstA [Ancylobacter sp. IITR112]|uniref:glutathione transferase GstA n=1 Tax=Ancylobacter sp. IITR112 TaxID=3138073 RepID=UPI003529F413